MPNVYRVISLSLAMSLFFAAPLLLVQPVSFQLKKEQSLAARLRQPKRVTVEWLKGSDSFCPGGSEALAKSLLRAREVNYALPKGDSTSPSVVIEGQEEYGDHLKQDWNDASETTDLGGVRPVSDTSL